MQSVIYSSFKMIVCMLLTACLFLPATATAEDIVIELTAYPPEGGTVTGGGTYNAGAEVTVRAVPNTGWEFMYWSEDTDQWRIVSDNPTYSFTADSDRFLEAFFHEEMPPDEDHVITVSAYPPEGGTVTGGGTYNAGSSVTVRATPNTGWEFAFWADENWTVVSTSASYSFTAEADRILKAYFEEIFEPEDFVISVSASPAEGGTVTGGGIYEFGSSVTVTATPNTGWEFVKWADGVQAVSTSPSYSFTAASDRTLRAYFEEKPIDEKFTISVSAEPREAGNVFGGGIYFAGDDVTLTARANSGWEFVQWIDGWQVVSTSNIYIFKAASDRDVVAYFERTDPEEEHEITVSVYPAEGGTATGGGTYATGAEATVTASASQGWRFVSWFEGEAVVSASESYTFMVEHGRNLVAYFEEIPPEEEHEITVSVYPAEGGTATGGGTYATGAEATVTASAAQGWRFVNWTEGEEIISTSESYTFSVEHGRNLVAVFSGTEQYTVTVSSNPQEGGEVSGAGTYYAGEIATVTAQASSDWEFMYWADGPLVVSTSPSHEFVVHNDHTLTARFIPKHPEPGLVAWYRFDGDFNDHSGNDYHGANAGASWTSDRHGREKGALSFDGRQSGVALNNGFPEVFQGSFTISMWVNFHDYSRNILLGNCSLPVAVNFERWRNNGLRIWWNGGERDIRTQSLPINVNQWHLVTFVRDVDHNRFLFYLDGNEVYSSVGIGSHFRASNPLHIGRDSRKESNEYVTNGKIDDVRVYNRVLPGEEIQSLFNSQNSQTDLEKADTLFNWLEMIFPDLLPSGPDTQASNGMVSRHYSTDMHVFTYVDHLFYIDQESNIYDLGLVDVWLADIEKINQVFDRLESLVPDLLPSGPHTQALNGIVYRYYPTNVYLYTYMNILYFVDQEFDVVELGPMDDWLNDE